jgi:adenosylhomocysteine nucleosidase
MTGAGESRVFGVVAPMPSELRPFAKAVGLTPRADDPRVREGSIDGTKVIATLSGMGTKGAAEAAARLIDAGAQHVVVMGIAGGLVPETPIGEMITPEVVLDRDAGGEYKPLPLGGSVAKGRLSTSTTFTSDPTHIATLIADGVIAVDMETAAVGRVCEQRGVPWSVFRSISDKPSDGMVDESLFALANDDGSPNIGASLRYVATHPWKVPMLVRVARDAGVATRAAANAVIAAIRAG